ncbi:MAG: hypothetical protein LC642_01190 [Verrucomicrobiaceae bacterium]|nr:hypothetical protein [Verrucomicrobiaceae bacterium]
MRQFNRALQTLEPLRLGLGERVQWENNDEDKEQATRDHRACVAALFPLGEQDSFRYLRSDVLDSKTARAR